MTREEDLIRSTTTAIAATVRDVPPLGLRSRADVVIIGSSEPSRARNRRWRSRLAPVGAVVTVAAVAVALVAIARAAPNDHGASPGSSPPAGTSAPTSVPAHFMAVTLSGDLVEGDSETGKTVATIDAPPGLVFTGVAGGANDNQAFVVSAAPAPPSHGSVRATPPGPGADLGRKLYLVRLAPGTAQPSRLIPLALTPPGGVLAVALSQSGRKLAVASAAGASGAVSASSVTIYSVATGRLLHAWTSAANVFGDNSHLPGLTWVDGDLGIMFATNTFGQQTITSTNPETVRRLDVTSGGNDLAVDSKVAWSTTEHCGSPLVSSDGSTIVCVSTSRQSASSTTMTLTWLAFSVAAPARGRTLYKVSIPYVPQTPPGGTTLWIDSSGGTALIEKLIASPGNGNTSVHLGTISNGHFTPSAPIIAGAPADWGITPPWIAW